MIRRRNRLEVFLVFAAGQLLAFAAVPPPVLVPPALENFRKKNLALLQAAMKCAPNRWMFQRYQAVALVFKGYHLRKSARLSVAPSPPYRITSRPTAAGAWRP